MIFLSDQKFPDYLGLPEGEGSRMYKKKMFPKSYLSLGHFYILTKEINANKYLK